MTGSPSILGHGKVLSATPEASWWGGRKSRTQQGTSPGAEKGHPFHEVTLLPEVIPSPHLIAGVVLVKRIAVHR